jgi:hypothetical protein
MIDLSKIQNLIGNTPANDSEIENIEQELLLRLPQVYKDLLKHSNGLSIGGGLLIYGTDNIYERNFTWEIDKYAKGFVAIGDDGAGNVFLMYQEPVSKEVFTVDAGDMNPNNAKKVTSDFIKWISDGCVCSHDIQNVNQTVSDKCDIVLINEPIGGTKDLLKIKNILAMEMPMSELIKGTKKLPFVLAKDFPYGKAMKLIEKLGTIGKVLMLVPIGINK